MSCEDTIALIADRLKGLLSAADEQRLSEHLATCTACRAEAQTMTAIWDDMGAFDPDVPHARMRARFHAALAVYEERATRGAIERLLERIWPERPALQAALALTLLVLGAGIGRGWPSSADAEIAALRGEIRTVGLALLDHQSASERLLGVAWSRRADPGPQVIDALLERVERDTNLNVRLAAVEALRARLDVPEVGAGLASALDREAAPLMQVTLAVALLEAGDAAAFAAVRRMLAREELDPAVREYVADAMAEVGAGSAPTPEV